MSHDPYYQSPESHPAGNQFSLRGMFLFTTAMCVILAVLALAIREPWHWLGVLGVAAICLAIIGVLEIARKMFPAAPRYRSYVLPPNLLQTMEFHEGENPFADPPAAESPVGKPPESTP
jgi:hypothetical protein